MHYITTHARRGAEQVMKEMIMKAYFIRSPNGTFGQTEAGCHAYAGQEVVVASVGLDATDEEIATFMAMADLRLCFTLGNQREAGDKWGEMFPRVEMPIPHTREGLLQAMKVATKRRPSDPHIAPNRWGQHRIHFGDEPKLAGATVQMDGANLAYQRELLAGRA
jgi:hypothetical protein